MNEADKPAPDTRQPKRGNWQLRLIILVTLLPLVAAYVAFYTGWGVPDSTVNNGVLLTPAKDIKPLLDSGDPELVTFTDHKLWRLVLPVAGSCDEACAQSLYLSRQVHIRLGGKAERIERIALALDEPGSQYLASIAAQHPRLQVVELPPDAWQSWWHEAKLDKSRLGAGVYLLVDPQGMAFLAYSDRNDGNELLEDIKRILRYVPED